MSQRRKPAVYSPRELAFIEQNCRRPRADLHFEFVTKFDRFDVTLRNIKDLCKRKRWLFGGKGKCQNHNNPGHFKSGSLHRRFKGYERKEEGGYVSSYDPKDKKTVRKHRRIWEEAKGAIPDGMVLMCRTKDKSNCDPSNWVLVEREMTRPIAIRGFDVASPDLQETILAVAKIELNLRRRTGRRETRDLRIERRNV